MTSKEDGAPDSEAVEVLTVGLTGGVEDEGSVDGLLLRADDRVEGDAVSSNKAEGFSVGACVTTKHWRVGISN